MAPILLTLAAQVGLPMLKSVLAGKLGPKNADLVTRVVAAVADRAGTTPEGLAGLAATTPDQVKEAMRYVEGIDLPEMVPVYLAEVEAARAAAEAEREEGGWRSAWRPAGMWLIFFLWLWNVIVLHIANAVWKIALPPMDLGALFQLSALYLGLYMGGHTVKDVAARWGAK